MLNLGLEKSKEKSSKWKKQANSPNKDYFEDYTWRNYTFPIPVGEYIVNKTKTNWAVSPSANVP